MAVWHFLVWYQWFLLGGILFCALAWLARCERRATGALWAPSASWRMKSTAAVRASSRDLREDG